MAQPGGPLFVTKASTHDVDDGYQGQHETCDAGRRF